MDDMITALKASINSGNLWVPESVLRKKFGSLAPLKPYIIDGTVLFHKATDEQDQNLFTFPQYHIAENEIASNVIKIAYADIVTFDEEVLIKTINASQKKLGITLHEDQYDAVLVALKNPMMILTGGPGMGKTCVLQVFKDVLTTLMPNIRITFLAPTGKAARRVTESTGSEAFTTNRKIQVWEGHMTPTLLSETDVVIVDEFSMSDAETSAALFKAIIPGTRVVIVGDVDQLPSVGPGCVLQDLINSDVVPVVRLTKTFRQAGDSCILLNTYKIKNGNTQLETDDKFKMVSSKNFDTSAQIMLEKYLGYVSKYGIENVACLVPLKTKGAASACEMNKRIQAVVNKPDNNKWEVVYYDTIFRMGDLVMQLKNRRECVNGDIGKIIDIKNDEIYVKYLEDVVVYKKSQYKQLTLAYAMSIHKSQGSEYKAVVTCLNMEHGNMLQRNLLYTSVSRAKEEITVVGEQKAIEKAINTTDSTSRITLLVEKLQYEYRKYMFFKEAS